MLRRVIDKTAVALRILTRSAHAHTRSPYEIEPAFSDYAHLTTDGRVLASFGLSNAWASVATIAPEYRMTFQKDSVTVEAMDYQGQLHVPAMALLQKNLLSYAKLEMDVALGAEPSEAALTFKSQFSSPESRAEMVAMVTLCAPHSGETVPLMVVDADAAEAEGVSANIASRMR